MKRAMGQNKLDDGEFWMEFFTDFCREFEEVSICTLGPDFNHDGIVDSSQVWNRFWKYAIGASSLDGKLISQNKLQKFSGRQSYFWKLECRL